METTLSQITLYPRIKVHALRSTKWLQKLFVHIWNVELEMLKVEFPLCEICMDMKYPVNAVL